MIPGRYAAEISPLVLASALRRLATWQPRGSRIRARFLDEEGHHVSRALHHPRRPAPRSAPWSSVAVGRPRSARFAPPRSGARPRRPRRTATIRPTPPPPPIFVVVGFLQVPTRTCTASADQPATPTRPAPCRSPPDRSAGTARAALGALVAEAADHSLSGGGADRQRASHVPVCSHRKASRSP